MKPPAMLPHFGFAPEAGGVSSFLSFCWSP